MNEWRMVHCSWMASMTYQNDGKEHLYMLPIEWFVNFLYSSYGE